MWLLTLSISGPGDGWDVDSVGGCVVELSVTDASFIFALANFDKPTVIDFGKVLLSYVIKAFTTFSVHRPPPPMLDVVVAGVPCLHGTFS